MSQFLDFDTTRSKRHFGVTQNSGKEEDAAEYYQEALVFYEENSLVEYTVGIFSLPSGSQPS